MRFKAPLENLKTVYILFIRSLLGKFATVWHSYLSQENVKDLKRVQKSARRIMLKELVYFDIMSHPFQVDFSLNCANLLLVVVLVKLPGSMCCTVLVFF